MAFFLRLLIVFGSLYFILFIVSLVYFDEWIALSCRTIAGIYSPPHKLSTYYINCFKGLKYLYLSFMIKSPIILTLIILAFKRFPAWTLRIYSEDRPLLIVLAIGIIVQVLLLSYPPFVGELSSRFLEIARQIPFLGFQSNLFHPTGYPFILSFFVIGTKEGPAFLSAFDRYTILIFHKVLFLVGVYFVYQISKTAINRALACLAAGLFEVNIAYGVWTHYPLPAFILSFVVLFSLYQIICKENPNLVLLGVVNGLGMLFRPNYALVIVGILPFLCWKRPDWVRRGMVYLVCAVSTLSLYIFAVHLPSTGALKYSYAGGGNLYTHLSRANIYPKESFGPNSRLLVKYASAELPEAPIMGFHEVWRKLEDNHPIRVDFTKMKDPTKMDSLELIWAIGKAEADRLFIAASVETISHNAIKYIASVFALMDNSFNDWGNRWYLPRKEYLDFRGKRFLGFQETSPHKDPLIAGSPAGPATWHYYFLPGVFITEWLFRLTDMGKMFYYIFGLIVAVPLAFRQAPQGSALRRLLMVSFCYLLPTMALAGVPDARYVYPILPALFLSAVISLYSAMDLFRLVIDRIVHRGKCELVSSRRL